MCKHACISLNQVFLLDPDDPGGTGKPGDVIRGSGDGSPPAGYRGRPLLGVKGAKPPKRGYGSGAQKLNRF